jgi:hypothetical protein
VTTQVPASVERVMRRVHRDGRYESVAPGSFDAHLSDRDLQSLVKRVNSIPGARAVLELAAQLMDRSHTLHVSEADRPTWEEFNRLATEPERLHELRAVGEPLLYWNIRLSRLGPFWASTWNRFFVRRGRVGVEVCAEPAGFEWHTIICRVTDTLQSLKLEHLDYEVLDKPVPWLSSSADYLLESRGQYPGPTVYNVLFEDLY